MTLIDHSVQPAKNEQYTLRESLQQSEGIRPTWQRECMKRPQGSADGSVAGMWLRN
jgi:hypothetical protein